MRVERCCLFGKLLPVYSIKLSSDSRLSLPPIPHLHNDLNSLDAWALTARDWLPSARYHRFRSIRLHSAKKIDSFHQFPQVAPGFLPYFQEATICDRSGYVSPFILEAAANTCLTFSNLERIGFNNRISASTSISGLLSAPSTQFKPAVLLLVRWMRLHFFPPILSAGPQLRPFAFPPHGGALLSSSSLTPLSPSASSKISKFFMLTSTDPCL